MYCRSLGRRASHRASTPAPGRHPAEHRPVAPLAVERWWMAPKVGVVIERDERGCYAWRPELKGCQSQGKTVGEALANIREAIELFLETLTDDERSAALSREILTTAVEVQTWRLDRWFRSPPRGHPVAARKRFRAARVSKRKNRIARSET